MLVGDDVPTTAGTVDRYCVGHRHAVCVPSDMTEGWAGFLESEDGTCEPLTRLCATLDDAMKLVNEIVRVLDDGQLTWEFVGTHYALRTPSGTFTVEKVEASEPSRGGSVRHRFRVQESVSPPPDGWTAYSTRQQ